MFEYSFVDSGKTRRPLLVAVACLGEAMLIGGLVLAPLLFVEALPERALFNVLMLAPVPTAPPSPPPMLVAKRILHAAQTPRKFNPDALVSPVVVPKVVAIINEAPSMETDAIAGGVPGGIPGVPMAVAGVFSSVLSVAAYRYCRRRFDHATKSNVVRAKTKKRDHCTLTGLINILTVKLFELTSLLLSII